MPLKLRYRRVIENFDNINNQIIEYGSDEKIYN